MLKIFKIIIVLGVLGIYTYSLKFHKAFQEEVTFTSQFCKPGELVYDIGANMGRKTDVYLACGAHVVCVEPQPKCIRHLHDKYVGNSHVTIVPKGVADHEGTIDFHLCSKAHFIATCSPEWTNKGCFADHGYVWDKTVTIGITTLDTIINSYGTPRFCKIDVENFEPEVLAGLSHPIPILSFEYHEEYANNIKKCLTRLEELGYKKFNFALESNTSFFLNEWVSSDQVLTAVLKTPSTRKGWPAFGDIYAKFE